MRIAGAFFAAVLAAGSSPVAAYSEPSALNILCFNIRYGSANDGENAWAKRKTAVFDVLNKDYDIIGLQEVEPAQHAEVAAQLKEYGSVYRTREQSTAVGEGAPIYFKRSRFEFVSSKILWLSDTPTVAGSKTWGNNLPRIVTIVSLKDKLNNKTINVANSHYDYQFVEVQVKSSQFIQKELDKMPSEASIVMGDFNADADTVPLKLFTESTTRRFIDSWRALFSQELPTWHDWKGTLEGKRIDFILADARSFEVEDAKIFTEKVGGRFPSDHYPIAGRVSWK